LYFKSAYRAPSILPPFQFEPDTCFAGLLKLG
jgi:hypothetical protein